MAPVDRLESLVAILLSWLRISVKHTEPRVVEQNHVHLTAAAGLPSIVGGIAVGGEAVDVAVDVAVGGVAVGGISVRSRGQ